MQICEMLQVNELEALNYHVILNQVNSQTSMQLVEE